MKFNLTKQQRRELRDLVGLAHERELSVALKELDMKFEEWKQGRLCAADLRDAIRTFNNRQAKDIDNRYHYGHLELAFVAAINRGILQLDEISEDLLQAFDSFLKHDQQT